MDEIRRKELGPFSHFLDGIWRNVIIVATGTLVISAVWVLVWGEFALYMIPASILLMQVASGIHGLRDWRRAERRKRLYDTPHCQAFLRSVEARARGVIASQRGTVWVVMDPDSLDHVSRVRVLSDREYQQYRQQGIASGQPLDEVRIGRRSLGHTVVREGREHFPRHVDFSLVRTPVRGASGRIERWAREGDEHGRGGRRGSQRRASGSGRSDAASPPAKTGH
ncbi:hypothetical protein V5F53_09260 [Xanthobacter sp. V4C-4]|uniref:hypothetical protein n=1 Tax=Xanthobacter cornucopiae TaxID=3119924 RepID=UPI0037280D78